MSTTRELDNLRKQVFHKIAVDGLELTVTDEERRTPVVVALADERLAVMVGRVANVGGSANVFVADGDRIYALTAVKTECALFEREADNMVVPERADSSVGMFLDALHESAHGINLSMPRPFPETDSIKIGNPRELVVG